MLAMLIAATAFMMAEELLVKRGAQIAAPLASSVPKTRVVMAVSKMAAARVRPLDPVPLLVQVEIGARLI